MLHNKAKKFSFLLCICVISWLLTSPLTQADEVNSWGGESGSIDAGKAAVQRAAIEKRKARIKQKKEAEAKKAAEAQQGYPSENQKPVEEQNATPSAQQ